LEKAAYFGRPLFASLQTKGELLMELPPIKGRIQHSGAERPWTFFTKDCVRPQRVVVVRSW
jgi:hypothetical protein